jgi:hypothetical protein
MAANPTLPYLVADGRRLAADIVSRGGNDCDVQLTRTIGSDADAYAEVGAIYDATAGPAVLYTYNNGVAYAAVEAVAGVTTASAYSAGDQVGDVAALSLPAGTKYHLDRPRFIVIDVDSVIPADAQLWLLQDLGGGFGDAGDGNNISGLDSPQNLLAVPIPLIETVTTPWNKRKTYGLDNAIPLTSLNGLMLSTGAGTPTWTTADPINIVMYAQLLGVTEYA